MSDMVRAMEYAAIWSPFLIGGALGAITLWMQRSGDLIRWFGVLMALGFGILGLWAELS